MFLLGKKLLNIRQYLFSGLKIISYTINTILVFEFNQLGIVKDVSTNDFLTI